MMHLRQIQSFLSQPRPRAIGLDIGGADLAFVQCSQEEPPKLLCVAQASANGLAKLDDNVRDTRHFAQVLFSTWGQLNTKNRRVTLALPARLVRYQILNMPRHPSHALQALLEAEAADLLKLPVTAISMDYQLLPARPDADPADALDILLCAVPLELVTQRVHMVEQAGLHVAGIEVDSFALLAVANGCPAWHSARCGRRLLVQMDQNSMVCHTLQAGALLPDQPETRYPIQTTQADQIAERLSHSGAEAILLTGDLAPGSFAQLQHSPALIDPFAELQMDAGIDRAWLSTQTQVLTLAYGLALGNR